METLEGPSTEGFWPRAYRVPACCSADTAPPRGGIQPFAVDVIKLPTVHQGLRTNEYKLDAVFAAAPDGDKTFLRLANEATQEVAPSRLNHSERNDHHG